MFRFVLHVLVVLLVGVVAFYLYGAVLPSHAAIVLAVLIAALELVSPIVAKNHGLSARIMGKLALPLVGWPILAISLERGLRLDWATGMAVAAVGAVATGFLSAGHGSGWESLRLAGAGTATAIALYAMVAAIVTGGPAAAMAAASIAVGIATLVVYQTGVWPGRHERALLWATGACGCVALFWGASLAIAMM
jgi:hypothetical protein